MPSPCFGTFALPPVPHARLKPTLCDFSPPSSVLSRVNLHEVHRDLKYVFCEIFGSDKWPGDRPEHILFCPKDLSPDIVVTDFGMYVALTCSLEMPLTCV